MNRRVFRLQPKPDSGFHFGRQGYDFETSVESLGSDSLFSALVVTYKEVYGDATEFLALWETGDPPFLLSSLFPCAGDVPFLPLPRLMIKFAQVDPRTLKKLKKVKYVSPGIFNRLVGGEVMDEHWSDGPRVALQDGAVWLEDEDRRLLPIPLRHLKPALLRESKVWVTEKVPRVRVDRITSAANIYHAGRTVFAEGCGLWFLADIHREGDLLTQLVDELSQSGLGGGRSAGYGAFTVGASLPAPALPSIEGAQQALTLARYYPRIEELEAGVLGQGAAYELVTIGGWLATAGNVAERRRRVRMIEAGSVLDVRAGAPIRGQLADVRPHYASGRMFRHAIYRNGYALLVGVRRHE